MLERRREDALPENRRWVDDGCEVSPSCLSCPLERCRYDVPGGLAAVAREARAGTIRELYAAGEPVGAIAARFGISKRTVFRALGGQRDEV